MEIKMKIRIINGSTNKEVIEGDYEYLEGSIQDGKPSFEISLGGSPDHMIEFRCEDLTELDTFIESLKNLKQNLRTNI